MRSIAALIGLLLAAVPAQAQHRYFGETFDCRFPKAGHVVIDTREPGASITVNGKRHLASGGSDFYQSIDGEVVLMFGPGMRWWEFGIDGDRATRCVRWPNRR